MSLVERTVHALRKRVDSLSARAWERIEARTLLQRYRKNTLTHGIDFLRGDDEIAVFTPHESGQPQWRPIPNAAAASLSRAALNFTESGSILLRGHYGGARAGLQLLEGSAHVDPHVDAIGAGACGMGSTARWMWDLSQHHWLELRFRSDGSGLPKEKSPTSTRRRRRVNTCCEHMLSDAHACA